MNSIQQLLLGVGVLLFANLLQAADLAGLAVTEQQFQTCAAAKPGSSFAEVKLALQHKQYALARQRLGIPGAHASAEAFYLYGKAAALEARQARQQGKVDKSNEQLTHEAERNSQKALAAGYAAALYDQALALGLAGDAAGKLRLLKQAADKHYIPAMLRLAEEKFVASATFEQRIEAQVLVQEAAELDPAGKIKLASYYLHEDAQLRNLTGYDKNVTKAIEILAAAAQQCNAEAAYKLFQLAEDQHKPNDLPQTRARYWLEAAARLGLAQAQGELASEYYDEGRQPDKALYWARLGAEQDDLRALLTLGRMYYSGKGTEQNHSQALQYYEKALHVDSTNRLVQNQLGIMYYKGEGSEVDFRRAATLCKQAANKGQAGCQYYLGLMYVNGEGVTQDIDTGISWMKKSAAQDFPIAKNWLRENW